MRISIQKKYSCLYCTLFLSACCFAQVSVTIPWSATVDVTFGQGKTNPGPPLNKGTTSLQYTTAGCPPPGTYTVVNAGACPALFFPKHDAGHIFFDAASLSSDSGYMMLATYNASTVPLVLFADTVRNLCSNSSYLFWAGMLNASRSTCGAYPNCTYSAETLSGQVIQSFQTGDIGTAGDKKTWYVGYYDQTKPPPQFSYYGGVFSLPAGVTDIVVKITANPSTADPHCQVSFLMDNILLSPVGPDARIAPFGSPDGWVAGACFNGNKPVVLKASIDPGYLSFGTSNYVSAAFASPAYQWQQSTDNGFTWTDIAGETSLNLSHLFSIPDTFYLRMRSAEAGNIANIGCSVLSNVVQVQVDGLPSGTSITSNSPVCTDAELIFTVAGGASYVSTGPDGFYDISPFPHIYNPALADSGWYYTQISSFGGCTITDSVQVKIRGPNVHAGTDAAICYGKAVQLQASGGDVYEWSPATGLSSSHTPRPWAAPIRDTKYQVKVTDTSGCSARAFVNITLKDSILKAAISGTDLVCPKDMAVFKDTSIGKIIDRHWDLGNGQSSPLQNPPAQQYPAGSRSVSYAVRLFVTDSAGCADTAVHIVQSVNNCYIAVPNAFTPNGDGVNDYLYPLNAYKARDLSFSVYNRYGQLIFQTRDRTKKWDGTISGSPQPAGTYVWMLQYTDGDTGQKVFQKGTAVLIR